MSDCQRNTLDIRFRSTGGNVKRPGKTSTNASSKWVKSRSIPRIPALIPTQTRHLMLCYPVSFTHTRAHTRTRTPDHHCVSPTGGATEPPCTGHVILHPSISARSCANAGEAGRQIEGRKDNSYLVPVYLPRLVSGWNRTRWVAVLIQIDTAMHR